MVPNDLACLPNPQFSPCSNPGAPAFHFSNPKQAKAHSSWSTLTFASPSAENAPPRSSHSWLLLVM